jgi:hypothetical protein
MYANWKQSSGLQAALSSTVFAAEMHLRSQPVFSLIKAGLAFAK